MEHILVSQIMEHLESDNILTEIQGSFRCKHSCEAFATNDLAKTIDNKAWVDMVFLDFEKLLIKLSTPDWNTNWSIMEYKAIYLDNSSNFLKITHSK